MNDTEKKKKKKKKKKSCLGVLSFLVLWRFSLAAQTAQKKLKKEIGGKYNEKYKEKNIHKRKSKYGKRRRQLNRVC